MKEIKGALEPVLKMIDQLDNQTVLAICGIMLILTAVLGGIADVVALLSGVWIGIAVYKKFLN
jgi:hypothetical protein